MTLYKRVDFAKLCGIAPAAITVNIGRNKIILSGNLIDDSIHENALFLSKYTREKFIDGKHAPQISQAESDGKKSMSSKRYEIDTAKKMLDIKKINEEYEILQLKKEKLQGLLIPTRLAQAVTISLSESLKIAFHEGVENLIVILSQKKQLSASEMADIRKELVVLINGSLDKAILVCKKSIKNIVKEYSEKKG